MFWLVMLLIILAVIGLSVLIGLAIKDGRRSKISQQEMTALKASGAFKHRKSNF